MILQDCNGGFPRSHIRCPQGISNTSGVLPRTPFPCSVRGHNDVSASAPPSHPCVSVMMTPLFMRFKSMKSDEAKEKEAAHRAAWLPRRSIWTHPFQRSRLFTGHSLSLPRRGQRRRILLMIGASWTFVNEQWKTEQCLKSSERTDALDWVHSSLWWRHYMSLIVYDSFSVSNCNDGMGSSVANRRPDLTIPDINLIWKVAFKTLLIRDKLTRVHFFINGIVWWHA